MAASTSSTSAYRDLEQGSPRVAKIAELLRSGDEGVVHAAVLHVEARLRGGEMIDGLAQLLPPDILGMPPESQLVLSRLAVDGFQVPVPAAAPDSAPSVRLAWLRALLLERPDTLHTWEATPIGWEAVLGLPPERVVGTGLLVRIVESAQANVRERSIEYLRASFETGLLSRSQAHDLAIALARDASSPIALAAMRFLRGAWAFGIPLPELPLRPDDLDFCVELIALLGARGEVQRVRRLVTERREQETLVPGLMEVLGEIGDAADVGSIVCEIQNYPHLYGPSGLKALVSLKRRGISPDDEEVRALVDVFLNGPALDCAAAAEAMSSRSDLVVAELSGSDVPWARAVPLIEAFGTQRAVRRLVTIVQREEERAGWWYAIGALGRLGVLDAEADILGRFDAEPDACLAALRHIGSDQTVRQLTARLSNLESTFPVWATDAATLLFHLEPSTGLFESLSNRGLLTSEILGALPAHSPIVRSTAMRAIVSQTAQPLRIAAIRATGRTGGPLAAELLSPLLSDPDDDLRSEALSALRTLGVRLKTIGSARPTNLAAAPDPGGALVADTILRRLRDRSAETEGTARLLDALAGLDHPQLVPVVRPYLRHHAPEIRKRAIACLAVAGPSAAPWLLPCLSEEDVTISRQVLLALARTHAKGLAKGIAAWLDKSNMNLKKTAAEALAVSGDVTALPKLLYWIAIHDNPGFRELLTTALKGILASSYRSVILDRLADTPDSRSHGLLTDALSGQFSATEVAAIVCVRSEKGSGTAHWSASVLRKIFAGEFAFREGSLATFEVELRRRGLGDRIPSAALEGEGKAAWRAPAVRAGVQLSLALRESPISDHGVASILTELQKANVRGQLIAPRLSRWETCALLDVYTRLTDEARAGALQVLANSNLDSVSRLRVARLLITPPANKVPTNLMACRADTMSANFARTVTDWPDAAVRDAAVRVLLLEDRVEYAQLPETRHELVIQDMVRKGAFDVCLEWSRQHHQLPLFVRTMHQVCGSAFTIECLRKFMDLAPDLLGVLLPEMTKLGRAGDGELARIAKTASIAIGLREQALAELGRRIPASVSLELLRHLMNDDHVVLREQAARQLLHLGDEGDRHEVLQAFLQGRFREQFAVQVEHRDLPLLEGAVGTVQGPARLHLVRLLERLEGPRKIEFLVGLWKSGDSELKAKCRDALRGVEPNRVLPFIQKELDEGNLSILDVLGATASVPRVLVTRFMAGDATWERFLERMAGGGILHAPGLSDVLVRSLGSKGAGPNAVSLLVRLSDWSQAGKIQSLVAALKPVLTGRDREQTLAQILDATGQVNATIRTRVLVSVGQPTDRAVVSALADAVLQNTAVRELLPEDMTAAVDREMTSALDGEPERVRRILSYRAARAKTDVEREALTDVLERSMGHASARVRMHAHRLLRTHAERPRYLAATRPLLRDGDAATVRSAIRVLAFGGDVDSVAEIADLLSHSQAVVRNAARDGLVHLGAEAVPLLTKAMGRARPDRREAYAGVLERIRSGLGADVLDEDDGQETDRS